MDYRLEVVVVPVTDVDRAKHFYAEQVGFHVDVDRIRGAGCADRPDDAAWVGLLGDDRNGPRRDGAGSLKGLQLCVADIEAAHAELAGRGVPVSPVRHHDGSGFVDGKGDDWNAFMFFDDPDGNGWAIQESPIMRAALESER